MLTSLLTSGISITWGYKNNNNKVVVFALLNFHACGFVLVGLKTK